jgi:hypothetical protein
MRLVLALAALLLFPTPSLAQDVLGRAADALRVSPVYVDPDAERAISDEQADDLRREIDRRDAGPLYLAVLPASAADEAGGDADAALARIANTVQAPGTYAAVVGDHFRAGATGSILPRGEAGRLAAEALQDGGNTETVLSDFVRRVGEARQGDGGGDGGESSFPWFLVALVAIPAALLGLRARRRRRAAREELEQVRDVARDDLIALGSDIASLDLDVEMPGVDAEAREHYGLAVERYQQAEEALDRVQRPQDIERVTSLLEEGRWAMTATKARLAGQPAPERRLPCFFDPRHGPSVTDVSWAPPGGTPRPVPACAADAQRIADGEEPATRQVSVNGQLVPYWQAGPAFMPWAGGFFGAGLLPGLFVGSVLGSTFGGFGGWGAPGDAYAGDAGDFGGFDAGDFGGGDMDLGGGDFGGGDF